MRGRADGILFGASFLALSAVLGWLFWNSKALVGAYSLNASMLAVPVISAMLASVGFSWRRKLIYTSITVGLYVLSGIAAELVGLEDVVRQQLTTTTSFPSLWVVLYMAWLTTFPFVMLVLFVGRSPSLLWSRQAD